MKKILFIMLGVITVALAIIAYSVIGSPRVDASPLKDADMTIYKDMSCGCCGVYQQYLNSKGVSVHEGDASEVAGIKDVYRIPTDLRSCHTLIVNGYFVEGHVPVEAIAKLLREKPDIAGIALQGMPSGSPGMPGGKEGPFIVYAVGKDGTRQEFMRI